MTAAKSLFNKNIFTESLKQSKYVIILHTFAIFVMTTLSAYMTRWQYKDELLTENDYPGTLEAIKNNLMGYNGAMFWLIVFAAAVIVVVNFSYLFKINSMQFYNSMPYKRSCMYISKAASCFVGLLAPVVMVFGINLFIYYGNMGISDKAPVTELLTVASNVIICYSVVLSIMLFAVSVSGNIFATAFASGFAALWHIVTVIAVVMCCYVWFESFEITPDDNLIFIFPPTLFLEHIERETGWQNVFWAFSAINIIAFPLLGLWCYTKRKSENTTKFFVFDKLASFFKYYVSFIGALGLGCIFADFDIPVLLVLVSYGIVFVVLYCVLQALFEKNVQSLLKNIKRPLVVSVGFMIALAPLVCGLWEVEMIHPGLVQSVEIGNNDFCITISDRENVEKTLDYLETNGEGDMCIEYEADLKIPFFNAVGHKCGLSREKYEEYMDSILSSDEYIEGIVKKIEESPNYEIYTPTGSLSYYNAEDVEGIRKDIEILVEEMGKYDYQTKKDSGVWGMLDNKEGDLKVRIYNCYNAFTEKTENRQKEAAQQEQDVPKKPAARIEVMVKCCADALANISQVYTTDDEEIVEKLEKAANNYWFERNQPVYITLYRKYTREEMEQFSVYSSWTPVEDYTVNYYDLPKEIREIINPDSYSYQTWLTNGAVHLH